MCKQCQQSIDSVPYEIKKWSWGAFMFNVCWGIGNYTYWPLLCLIPGFNLIWMIVCGILGNEWAWKSGKFNSVEDFLAIQASWNKAGLIHFILSACILVICIPLFILFILAALADM